MSRHRDSCPLDCKVYVGELGNSGRDMSLKKHLVITVVFVMFGWPLIHQDSLSSCSKISRDAKDAVRALDGKYVIAFSGSSLMTSFVAFALFS